MSNKNIVRLTPEQLEQKAEFIRQYCTANNAADGSAVDANANVSSKNCATLSGEIHKDINVQIKRYMVSQAIEKAFGKEVADEYNRQIENHEIYVHDESHFCKPYCVSISMYPFLFNGLSGLGGESKAPKHLKSFCGNFINLVYAIASQFAGAVATVEFLPYFDYFARKDLGEDYLEKYPNEIANYFQQVVYTLNQPASSRDYQSVFWNISIFDSQYFKSLFEDFRFPDGEPMNWNTIKKLQKFFMTWFNEERTKAVLTFPVVTAAILTDGEKPVDEEFEDMCAEQDSLGNSFFKYMSTSADSLASCCFEGNQKVVVRDKNKVYCVPFNTLSEKQYNVLHNGSWVKGSLVKLPNRPMYKIITANNKTMIVSDNHLNPTKRGDVETKDLTLNDYILFNTNKLDAVPEQDLKLTYNQGFMVGMFLGDGSFGSRTNGIYETNYSLNPEKIVNCLEILTKANEECNGSQKPSVVYSEDGKSVAVRVSNKYGVEFIQHWTNWEEGTYSYNKKLNLDCLTQSYEFRKGILDGWYATDGGNSNRCYTTSPELAENMELLITSLGLNSNIDVSDRTGQIAFISNNGEEYVRKYPLYCVRWYNSGNKRSMKDVFVYHNNSVYFKIVSIESVKYDKDIYCFEINGSDSEPYFTLPNGIITHNCRLRNALQDNTFSYSLGAGGVSTGSMNVITLNVNRFVQNCVKELLETKKTASQDEKMQFIKDKLKQEIETLHKFQIGTRDYLKTYLDSDMYPVYKMGYINMNKQFLTIGLNGLVEAAEFLGYKAGNNDDYKHFTSEFLKVIYDTNKEGKMTHKVMFNTEFVPAENLGVKNYNWDKHDGYVVNEKRNCYNSYMYPVEDEEVTALDKFVIHGKDNLQYLDGGSSLHLNLDEYPTKEGYKKLYRVAAKTGCNYWCTNVKVTCCEDCGYIDKHTVGRCPKCGSTNVVWASRVIGYLKKISSYSSERQKEETMRYYHKTHSMI